MTMDPAQKKVALRAINYGLLVLTATDGTEYGAAGVNWLSQASFEPPLVMVGVKDIFHVDGLPTTGGSKLPPTVLFESIINPNAGLSMGFESWQLTLKDGGAAMGIIRSETNDEVILALPGGATIKVAKNNIASREKLPTSLMPSGLNQALSKDDLVNLVAYLSSLKAAK